MLDTIIGELFWIPIGLIFACVVMAYQGFSRGGVIAPNRLRWAQAISATFPVTTSVIGETKIATLDALKTKAGA